MALWGKYDLKQANTATDGATVSGTTVTFAANTAATQSIEVGQWINITGGGQAMVSAVTNATQVTVHTSLTTVGSAAAWYTFTAPKNLATSATESANTSNIYGVDATEQTVANADLGGSGANNAPQHAGWVRRIDKGAGRLPRYRYETLVAMGSITGDAEDTDFVDT